MVRIYNTDTGALELEEAVDAGTSASTKTEWSSRLGG